MKENKENIWFRQDCKLNLSVELYPAVYGVDEGIDPNIQPEKQGIKPIIPTEVKSMTQGKPGLGQGRAGIKRKIKPHISPPLDKPIQSTE